MRPDKKPAPKTAEGLEQMLILDLPPSLQAKISIIVLDVSLPNARKIGTTVTSQNRKLVGVLISYGHSKLSQIRLAAGMTQKRPQSGKTAFRYS